MNKFIMYAMCLLVLILQTRGETPTNVILESIKVTNAITSNSTDQAQLSFPTTIVPLATTNSQVAVVPAKTELILNETSLAADDLKGVTVQWNTTIPSKTHRDDAQNLGSVFTCNYMLISISSLFINYML